MFDETQVRLYDMEFQIRNLFGIRIRYLLWNVVVPLGMQKESVSSMETDVFHK